MPARRHHPRTLTLAARPYRYGPELAVLAALAALTLPVSWLLTLAVGG